MSYHRYELPDPMPHQIGSTSTGAAILFGLILVTLAFMGLVGYALWSVMMWVMAL